MKASNIIIFVVVLIVIVAIFGYAIWDSKNNEENDINVIENTEENIAVEEINNTLDNTTQKEDIMNIITRDDNDISQTMNWYEGEWYISEEEYTSSEQIDELMDQMEDNVITEDEFENQLQDIDNGQVAELDIDECYSTTVEFDFILTGPAPTQRVAKIEDITVELDNNTGTFTYTDNWGTSGNGTITLDEGQIELVLETTSVDQGALWGVEGSYTFSYKAGD